LNELNEDLDKSTRWRYEYDEIIICQILNCKVALAARIASEAPDFCAGPG
jgi:hypothetical protein